MADRFKIAEKGKGTWVVLDSENDDKIVARARSKAKAQAEAKERNEKDKPPVGEGGRFNQLEKELSKKGVDDPAALAASIGRKKYGAEKFAELAAKGRRGN